MKNTESEAQAKLAVLEDRLQKAAQQRDAKIEKIKETAAQLS